MQKITEPKESVLWNLIKKALRDAIRAHGPVVMSNVGSSIKRIIQAILESKDFKDHHPEDEWNRIVSDTMSVYYKCELGATKTKLREVLKERDKYRDIASTATSKQEWIDRLRATVEKLNSEKLDISRELEAIKGTCKVQKLKHIRHQLTNKIAWSLWKLNGGRDGHAEEDWLLAEQIADILLQWKPNGEDTYYKYKV